MGRRNSSPIYERIGEAVALFQAGSTITFIAQKYGCADSTASRALLRELGEDEHHRIIDGQRSGSGVREIENAIRLLKNQGQGVERYFCNSCGFGTNKEITECPICWNHPGLEAIMREAV